MRARNGQVVIGDVIQAVDGKPVRSLAELTTLLEAHEVGDVVVLTIWREGQLLPAEIALGAPAG
jgi:S1-C subfamily serine protease